jgi:hypothetical protein
MEDGSGKFSMEIAAALHRATLQNGLHVKKVAAWTGANERTVKNWFSGQYGPSGEHLVTLAKHCNEVLITVLVSMGRQDLLVEHEIFELERRIVRLSTVLQEMKSKSN